METIGKSYPEDEMYIGRDVFGYPYNKKYPPDFQKYGRQYSGYATPYQETFFYDYAVQCYDVRFTYHGIDYYIVNWGDHKCYARTDEKLQIMYETFPDPITLIEQLKIEGKRLMDIMDDIEDIEVF